MVDDRGGRRLIKEETFLESLTKHFIPRRNPQ